MDEKTPPGLSASITQDAFTRQARAFARSPLQTDPARLRRLIEFVAPRSGERGLDVACGPGIVMAALTEAGLSVFGLELTLAMIRESVWPEGRYVQGEAGRLPFRDATFDVVVCRSAFHHFDDPAASMAEMARALRPGGRLIVEDMRAPDDPAQRAYHETIERLRDASHVRTLTRDDFLALSEGAGLEGFADVPAEFVVDFDEWIDRAFAPQENRDRARVLMEACTTKDRCGLKVWKEDGRLRFERRSLLFRSVRPEGRG